MSEYLIEFLANQFQWLYSLDWQTLGPYLGYRYLDFAIIHGILGFLFPNVFLRDNDFEYDLKIVERGAVATLAAVFFPLIAGR